MVNPFKDVNWKPDQAALRSFGVSLMIGFPVIAGVLAGLGWLRTHSIPEWPIFLAAGGFAAGLLFWSVPIVARPFYFVWYFVGCCIGLVLTNLLLAAFFYGVITPFGAMLRACGRNHLRRPRDPSASTYWHETEKSIDPPRYFRQF